MNTVFANISKTTSPTSESFLLIMSHILFIIVFALKCRILSRQNDWNYLVNQKQPDGLHLPFYSNATKLGQKNQMFQSRGQHWNIVCIGLGIAKSEQTNCSEKGFSWDSLVLSTDVCLYVLVEELEHQRDAVGKYQMLTHKLKLKGDDNKIKIF